MKKTYPKVPNHYADVVDSTVFAADDLVILEKLDGSNARLCVYDNRFSDHYSDAVHDAEPSHGDVFIGSKGNVRGRLSDDASQFDGNFKRLLTHLRETFDETAVLDLHAQYDSPLLLFGEHMVRHTLDYEYETNPPPAFLGFDVFRSTMFERPPANPFNEDFSGFLPLDEAWDVFRQAGLDTVAVLDTDATGVDPDQFTVPLSEYGAVQAEGVVFRSDSQDTRIKYVTAEFRERMHEAWGMREKDAETGAELFVARYLTNARIRKQVHKLVQESGEDAVTPSDVAELAVADAWVEELDDIRGISISLVPADIHSRAVDRAGEVISTMRTNAALNDASLDTLWADYSAVDDESTVTTAFDVDEERLDRLHAGAENADEPHREIVTVLLDDDRIHEVAEQQAADGNRSIGRWVIKPTADALRDEFWYDAVPFVAHLQRAFTPTALDGTLQDYIVRTIESRDDVDTSEKPEDWEPETNLSDSDLGGLF